MPKAPLGTMDNLMSRLLRYLPNATFGEDNEGQLIIHTDLQLGEDGMVYPFEAEVDT